MADVTSTTIARVRGKLIANPTDLSSAPTYGGTILGATRAHRILIDERQYTVRAGEWGGHEYESVFLGEGITLSTALRGWDSDAVAAVMPYTESTGAAAAGVANDDAKMRAGKLLGAALAMKLLFVPEKVTVHRAVLIYAAIPRRASQAEIMYDADSEAVMPVVFNGSIDTSGRVYQHRILSTMTL